MSKLTAASLLLVILLLGAFFRFYRIAEIPPGLYPDEAMNGNNALEALASGEFRSFYPENNGREGLFINLQALSVRFFGNEPWALRLISAVFGVLTIWGVFLLTKELFYTPPPQIENEKLKIQNHNEKVKSFKFLAAVFRFTFSVFSSKPESPAIIQGQAVALLSAFFLATSFWHINFSRIGFRAIMVPFFTVFALYFLLKGMRKGTIMDIVFAGIFTGLGFYTYLAFRFFPFVLLVPLGWYLWKWLRGNYELGIRSYGGEKKRSSLFIPHNSKKCIPCLLALFFLVTLAISLPLGIYFAQHPEDFFGRTSQVSIFSAESPLFEFAKSNFLTLQMFFYQGDCNWRHNFNCRPQLHPIVSFFFFIGICLLIYPLISKFKTLISKQSQNPNDQKEFRDSRLEVRDLILLSWLFFMSLPATLTREGLPHALRSIGLIPPVMILAGFGAWKTFDLARQWLERQKSRWPDAAGKITRIRREIVILLAAALLVLPVFSYRDYFIRWAYHPRTYSSFSTDVWHLGKFLDSLPNDTKKYVVVDRPYANLRQVGTSAQTLMFATGTFLAGERSRKNIEYIPLDEIDKISIEGKTTVAILADNHKELIRSIRKKFSSLKPKVPGDFVILEN